MKVAVLGSTGLVGRNVLKILAKLENVDEVYCPVRKVPEVSRFGILEGASKLDFEVVDVEKERDEVCSKLQGCEAVFCCLGTTLKQAGSKAAQERVDVRLPLTYAALAKKQGVKHFLCVSAMGANLKSPFFYNRLKGQLEQGLTMMGFFCLTLVRPSLLLGKHDDKRLGEEFLQKFFGKHPEWIPGYVRPVFAETVAAHLVASMLKPPVDHVCATDGTQNKRIIYNRVLSKTRVEQLF